MGRKISTLTIFLIFMGVNFAYSQGIWAGKDGNIRNVDARAMIIDEDQLYLATKNETAQIPKTQ